jgi:hypothetical protein
MQLQQQMQSITDLAAKMGTSITYAESRMVQAMDFAAKKYLDLMQALDRQLKSNRWQQLQIIESLKPTKKHQPVASRSTRSNTPASTTATTATMTATSTTSR